MAMLNNQMVYRCLQFQRSFFFLIFVHIVQSKHGMELIHQMGIWYVCIYIL